MHKEDRLATTSKPSIHLSSSLFFNELALNKSCHSTNPFHRASLARLTSRHKQTYSDASQTHDCSTEQAVLAKRNGGVRNTLWIVSMGIVLHGSYGTLTLSGTLFIDTGDATTVVGRFLGSTRACGMFLMYEPSGIRHPVTVHAAADEDVRS